MERRAILAIALSFVVLVVWTMLFGPKPPPTKPVNGSAAATSGAPAASGEVGSETSGALNAKGIGEPPASEAPASAASTSQAAASPRREAPVGAPPIVVDTNLARVEFSSVGG